MESVNASATGHSSACICEEDRNDSPRNIALVSNPVDPLLREVLEPVRVGMRVDDLDTGQIDVGHQYLHR